MKRREFVKTTAAVGVTAAFPTTAPLPSRVDSAAAAPRASSSHANSCPAPMAGTVSAGSPSGRSVPRSKLAHVMPTVIARDQSKEAAFEQLVDQLLDAIGKGDLQRLAAMHGKEPELRFAGSDGPFHHGWTGAGDDHPNSFEAWLTRAFSWTVSRPRLSKSDFQLVRLGANSFLTTCQVQREASGEMPSTQPAAQRLSLLWRQNKGTASYAIVHAHFSTRGARA